jgi:PAS domain S-box-containing protein
MIDKRDGGNRLAMDTAAWPYGQGEMAELIRTFDWASTPLGPILSWPQSLKAAVEVMLASGFPASMQWGKEAILLYNDASARILGSLHPAALGRPIFDALPARRPSWEPVLRRVLTGESVVFGEQRRLINEDGVEGEIWVDRAASPIRDETGAVVGLWEVFIDITAYAERQRKLAEDMLRETEAREAFLLRLSDELRALAEPSAIQAAACRMVGEHLRVNTCSYGEICGEEVVLRGTWGRGDAPPTERFAFAEYDAGLVEEFLAGRAIVVEDIENNPRLGEGGRERLRAAGIAAFIGVRPLKEAQGGAVFGVQSAGPRAWTASEVELIRDVAERTCAAVERARAEAALRASEEKYRRLFEAMDEGIAVAEFIRDEQGRRIDYRQLDCNAAFERLVGLDRPAIVGRRVSELAPGRYRSWVETYGRMVDTSAGERERLVDYVPKEDRWYEATAFPFGGVDRFAVLHNDVTARKRREANEAFLARLSDDFARLSMADEIMQTIGAKIGAFLGLTRCQFGDIDEEAGTFVVSHDWRADGLPSVADGTVHRIADFFSEEIYRAVRAGEAVVVEDALSDPRAGTGPAAVPGTLAYITAPFIKDGRWRFMVSASSATPRAWREDEVGLVRELAARIYRRLERARAEAALRDSEERFRQFAEASTDVLWIRDAASLRVEYRSPAFESIYGEKWDGGLAENGLKDWSDLVVSEDRERALACVARALSGERVTFEYRIKRPSDGEIRWLRGNVFPLLDGAGWVQRIGGIGRDTTAEKATAERMEVMVAELQHRTRNLMAVVQSIIAQTLASSEDLGAFKTRIDERLIALSRVQSLLSRSEQEPITIGALVRLELDALGRNVLLDRVEVSGPQVRLRNSTVQVLALGLHELATNARKYGALSTDQGRLRIGWHVEHIDGDPRLRLSWIEEHAVGVAVQRDRRGYGRELIERALPYSLNAETRYELDDAGLRCTIALPLAREGPKERGA